MLPPHLTFPMFLGKTVHLGVCGSIAAYKAAGLVRDFLDNSLRVTVTPTEAASRFITPLTFASLGAARVYGPMFGSGGEAFDHLEPGAAAGAMLIAPASANMLGKIACGLADDMLSCQAMAFDGPLLVAPAMNPRMWASAAVRENWARLLARGVAGIEPETGPMACGDTGQGRLASAELISASTLRSLAQKDLSGRKILVTLGPTREFWDAARFWSNPSTGLMGAAMAMAAWLRGAEVQVVSGPVSWWFPPDVQVTRVVGAAQMFDACMDLWPGCDACAATAAVSDFSPAPYGSQKFKKDPDGCGVPRIELSATRDILLAMGQSKRDDQLLIGFAAETGDVAVAAKEKLIRKRCDIVAGNPINQDQAGFAAQTNRLVVVDAKGGEQSWPLLPKTEHAWKLWDLALSL
ncbi:MAG: bifunctional phosphopantothenoylcysteine decarboxylase/phosphopantothenate--cysteine ligase CoaBC [Desulfovibrionaceae bacterium]|nr:bifunctional phosphopantothenoylcysteine decarboxylase/phosphopantothenate--cysteine ligase CoaBC [Desulfovibrionaceae bacterium]MBF0512601.1 bifunctional phosphopantothenoylcysteine decarboxylase/phosphopantothenate--cysteine ligase CoaBC [Desulfovibrionaceae bacterium]